MASINLYEPIDLTIFVPRMKKADGGAVNSIFVLHDINSDHSPRCYSDDV